jgi:hypothetical protein
MKARRSCSRHVCSNDVGSRVPKIDVAVPDIVENSLGKEERAMLVMKTDQPMMQLVCP